MSLHRTEHGSAPDRDDEPVERGAESRDPAAWDVGGEDPGDEIQVTLAARNRAPFRPLEAEFDVEERIGEGAFGVVFKAIERSTGRPVAVKRLHASQRKGALERLQLEMKAIVQLNHPHIVQLYRAAQDKAGHYLVLEWAAGGSLEHRLRDGARLPESEVLDLAQKLGSALAYAHRHQIVHRDIKPANILLTDSGEPKLADFGLAISPSDGARAESSGGSLLYAAPEQFSSVGAEESHAIDGRADLYALGKTLYHLLTGRPPASVLIDREIPRSLRRVIAKCVEHDPKDRFENAEQFLAELERARRASVVGEMGHHAVELLTPRARWILVCFAGLVVVCVLAIAIVSRSNDPESVATAASSTSSNAARFVLLDGTPSTRVLADDGDGARIETLGVGSLRVRLEGALDALDAREVRIHGDGLRVPLKVDANLSTSIPLPATEGRYVFTAKYGPSERTIATLRVRVTR